MLPWLTPTWDGRCSRSGRGTRCPCIADSKARPRRTAPRSRAYGVGTRGPMSGSRPGGASLGLGRRRARGFGHPGGPGRPEPMAAARPGQRYRAWRRAPVLQGRCAGPKQRKRMGAGLDTRAAGGLGVLPPSIHPSGNTYRWLPGRDPWSWAVPDAPGWLLELLDPPRPAPAKRRQFDRPLAAGGLASVAIARELARARHGSGGSTQQ